MTHRPGSRGLRGGLLVALVMATIGTSCADPPFARVNPNDPLAEFEVVLEGPDSSRMVGEILEFTIVSDPPIVGYTAAWAVSHNALFPLAPGRYSVSFLPGAGELPVQVSVAYGTRVATRTVTLRPAIP
jgi:hypothetical protein